VSTDDKPLSAGAARFLLDQLADDEAKRIEGLTDDELRAEIAQEGGRPWEPSSTEALLERVKARAAKGPGVVMAAVATDAEGSAPVARREPSSDARAGQAAVEQPAATVVPLAPRRRAVRTLLLLAATLALAVAAIAAVEDARRARTPRPKEPPIVPDVPSAHVMAPAEIADRVRDEAIDKCLGEEWEACGEKLDEAKRIDPGGESQPRVVEARAKIANWKTWKDVPPK
jgi:hypothetical protein